MNSYITIIIPVYNASAYIRECLESIRSQSLSDWKCILVDDGSTDDSGVICDEYVNIDSRFVVIHKVNEGVSAARNDALSRVSTDWVCFADADDYFMPNALESLYNVTKEGIDLVLGQVERFDNGLENYTKIFEWISDKVYANPFSREMHGASWGYLFRTLLFTKYNIQFNRQLRYSEDSLLVNEFLIHCNNVATISSVVYRYRISESSACSSKNYVVKYRSMIEASYGYSLLKQHVTTESDAYKMLERWQIHELKMALSQLYHVGWTKYHRNEFYNYYMQIFNNSKTPCGSLMFIILYRYIRYKLSFSLKKCFRLLRLQDLCGI